MALLLFKLLNYSFKSITAEFIDVWHVFCGFVHVLLLYLIFMLLIMMKLLEV